MALRVSRSCDFQATEPFPEHDADTVAEFKLQGVTYSIDICTEHLKALSEAIMGLGFQPARIQVGHNIRGAYLTATGRPFTTKQAREWLLAQGHEVSEVGRLTADQMELYAAQH